MSTKTKRQPQRLLPLMAVECAVCHSRVHFRQLRSRPTGDGKHRLVYLACPVCGAHATQLQEIGARRRRVYLYDD